VGWGDGEAGWLEAIPQYFNAVQTIDRLEQFCRVGNVDVLDLKREESARFYGNLVDYNIITTYPTPYAKRPI